MDASRTSACPACGALFTCAMEAGLAECWCARLPPLMSPAGETACHCPVCLAGMIAVAAGAAEAMHKP